MAVYFNDLFLKPLSVTTNVVGLQTDEAGHVGRNSSAYVTHVVGLQTDAVVVTEHRLRFYYEIQLLILLDWAENLIPMH